QPHRRADECTGKTAEVGGADFELRVFDSHPPQATAARATRRVIFVSYFFLRFSRRAVAQPSTTRCGTRVSASASGGTSFVIVEPAPTYAPLPMRTGATSCESEPMNAPSSMIVLFLFTPS